MVVDKVGGVVVMVVVLVGTNVGAAADSTRVVVVVVGVVVLVGLSLLADFTSASHSRFKVKGVRRGVFCRRLP